MHLVCVGDDTIEMEDYASKSSREMTSSWSFILRLHRYRFPCFRGQYISFPCRAADPGRKTAVLSTELGHLSDTLTGESGHDKNQADEGRWKNLLTKQKSG